MTFRAVSRRSSSSTASERPQRRGLLRQCSSRRCQPAGACSIDLLGFGESEAPTGFSYSIEDHAASIVALLDDLGLRGVTLVGHSMGGAIAIVIARTRPDLIARLVLAEANLDPQPGRSAARSRAVRERVRTRGREALVRTFVADGPRKLRCGASKRRIRSPSIAAPSRSSRTPPTYREMLARPSDAARPSSSAASTSSIPDIRWLPAHGIPVTIVPAAGHDMMTDQPDAFATTLADLVSS